VAGAFLRLPEVMDLRAAAPLANDLLAVRGQPVTLDASAVERLGGLCLQVLMAARQTWAGDHIAFTLANPSPAFADCLSLLGASFDAPLHG
jgi:chemotaxis protein CheX